MARSRPEEAAEVDVSAVKLQKEKGQNSVRYFTDWALPQLDLLLPETDEPIEVWTTLDPGHAARGDRLRSRPILPRARRARWSAWIATARCWRWSAAPITSRRITTAPSNAVRQPGSAWKLFVYLAALEAGYTPDDRVVDEPVTIDGWSPRNSGGTYAGEIDVRSAFAYSKNTVAAQLGNEVGLRHGRGDGAAFRHHDPDHYLSIDGARHFGSPADRHDPRLRRGFRTRSLDRTLRHYQGRDRQRRRALPARTSRSQQLVPEYVAAGITDLLQTAVNIGTGRAAQIGRPVAGKTGTTSSNKDGWFLGFSSGITTGVWMGRDDAKAVPGLQGGTAPARAFAAYMRYAVKDRPVEKFDTDLKLPEWQLEPDDEFLFGDPDDYYFSRRAGQSGRARRAAAAARQCLPAGRCGVRRAATGSSRPARRHRRASDDFLEQRDGPQPASASIACRRRSSAPSAPAGSRGRRLCSPPQQTGTPP